MTDEIKIGDTLTFAPRLNWWSRLLIRLNLARPPELVPYTVTATNAPKGRRNG